MWAFGTSPTGLALSETDLWSLTPREYAALRDQWFKMQENSRGLVAILQATLCNIHRGENEVPFIPADFLGTGNRAERKAEQMKDNAEALAMQSKLSRMKPNQVTPDLPAWAIN